MRLLQLAFVLFCSTLLFSCMRDRTTVVMLEDLAYIRFSGSSEGVSVMIDDRPPVELLASQAKGLRYEVQPGRRLIVLIRGETEILRRDIYLARGQIFDMRIPR